jgi:uncharacterized membrane protein
MIRSLLTASVAMVVSLSAGCGEKLDAVQETTCSGPPGSVTYAEVKPVLEQLCTGCHAAAVAGTARNGAPAAANLDSYQGLIAYADDANQRLQNESMPPSGFTKASPAQKELFQCWIDGGKKEQ